MMKKRIVSSCLAVMSLSCAPAFAGDDPASNTVLIPVRVLAFGVAAVIGTPVAVVKDTIKNIPKHTEAIADKMGGKDNMAAMAVAAPFGIVSGTALGALQGLYDGPKNSLDNCVEHPFSAASMSLSDKD
ncbi:MAG: hypothetical protein K2X27_09195 [Candidatus Obscuribacterales bacterium]|nr:hypothetical protein [Candidatus Obscuribacterales bacterium]